MSPSLFLNTLSAAEHVESRNPVTRFVAGRVHQILVSGSHPLPSRPVDLNYLYLSLARAIGARVGLQVQPEASATPVRICNRPSLVDSTLSTYWFAESGLADQYIQLVEADSDPDGTDFDLTFACHIGCLSLDRSILIDVMSHADARRLPLDSFDSWLAGFNAPLRFDDDREQQALASLSAAKRIAFVAACIERMLRTCSEQPLDRLFLEGARRSVIAAWDSVRTLESAEFSSAPRGVDPVNTPGAAIRNDANLADLVHAAVEAMGECCRSTNIQTQILAARRSFASMLAFVRDRDGVDVRLHGADERLLARAPVQAELARRVRDMKELRESSLSIEELRIRAETEVLS